ncbi:hypothetical protein E1B28_009367 [Marasmius oreades]|uniref:N-acetyltransferase domain-containing protein n=1 Tax=Marasmius oreades TaxID=181124 RepID=A0A9P7UV91_9AGAR|nr:uncharacterized protein E1B28_009367 [Marasmius oreades]KAG7093079.1 hypothetical protein E1B28_009367 [Marasmius oreades]
MGAHGQESLKISIRVFRPEDLQDVQKLYIETRIHGCACVQFYFYFSPEQLLDLFRSPPSSPTAGSPFRLALRQYLLTPLSYGFYSLFFIGICIFLRNPIGYLRVLGTVFIVSSVVFVVGTGFPIGMFAYFGFRSLYRGDMKDVATHYRVRESQMEIVAGASSFWVAEAEMAGGRLRKIVGCVGLDCFSNDDSTEGELKRMFVSPAFRGHGIATKLMQALLEHARKHGLKHIYLQTTALNDKAVVMYKKTGWQMVKKQTFRVGFLKGEGYDFRMKLVNES